MSRPNVTVNRDIATQVIAGRVRSELEYTETLAA
jgi:hypothetical protein